MFFKIYIFLTDVKTLDVVFSVRNYKRMEKKLINK